jgi:hydrogenase/urease accessory protein HupE
MSVLAALPLLAVLATAPRPHDPGLSSLRMQRDAERVVVHLAMANADFHGAFAVDRDGDGRVDAAELAAAQMVLAGQVQPSVVVHTAAHEGRLAERLEARLAENDDVELTFTFGPTTDATHLEVGLLRRLAHGHRCYAAVVDSAGTIRSDALLAPALPQLRLPDDGAAATAGFGQSGAFFVLGVEHILLGFDHLAFLLALLLGCRSWRRIVATVTAFTVAHSLTLVAAALGVVALPDVLVEATIAGSIAVVAAANLLQRGGTVHRWHFAFGFGLIHGFGFAGVLAELEVGGPHALLPLLTFNLGVEAGQMVFALVAVPLLAALARGRRGSTLLAVGSVATGTAGLCWLLERTLG